MLTTQLIKYCFSKKERLWLLPVITLLILLIPTLALANTLTLTTQAWTPQCNPVAKIRDFTIDTTQNTLYMLLTTGMLEIDQINNGALTNILCDQTTTGISNQQRIITHNGYIIGDYNTYLINGTGSNTHVTNQGTYTNNQWDDLQFITGTNNAIAARGYLIYILNFTNPATPSTLSGATYTAQGFFGADNTACQTPRSKSIALDQTNKRVFLYCAGDQTGDADLWWKFNISLSSTPPFTVEYFTDRFGSMPTTTTLTKREFNKGGYSNSAEAFFGSNLYGIASYDVSTTSMTQMSTCPIGNLTTLQILHAVANNELYAYTTTGTYTIDYTNLNNCTITNNPEFGSTRIQYGYEYPNTPYNGTFFAAVGATGNANATGIIGISGFTGSHYYNIQGNATGGGTTTTSNLTQLSIYQQPGYTFTDMSISNNIAHINSIDANSTATYIAVDAGSPSQLGSVTQKRIVKDYLNQTKNNAKGITSQDNWVFGAATDTLYYWTPAQTAANTLGTQTNTAITFLIDSNYYDFRDAAPLGNNQYVACLYNNKNDLYNQPHTEIYLINATNSTSLNYTDWGDAGSDECYSLVADQSSKYAYYTTPTSIVFINTSQPGGVSGSITYQNTPNIHNPGMLTYDVTNHNLLIATGTTGLDVIHLNNPTSTTYVMTCTPSGSLTITSGAATYNMNTLIGVGMQAYPPYNLAYFCPLTTGTTAPTSVQRIIQAQPLEAQTINNIIYIMGSNSLAAYIFTNTTTNNTIPPVVGTASATFTFINENNQPVPNVVSILSNYITSQTYTSVSNANGTATHANVPAGTYIWLYQPPSPYTDGSAQVTLATNEQLTYTQTLTTQAINPGLPNGTGTSQNRTCQDFIKNVWLCNMENTPCTTNLDCPSGQCETYAGGGKCSSFNYNLCDADNTPRNQRCVIKMTFKGIMAAIVNHILRYFLYYTILLIIIFLIAALLISRRRK